jgi:predicted HTH domain antitoxin
MHGAVLLTQLVYPCSTAYRCFMLISVTVPDDVVAALKLPPRSMRSDLRKKLAVHLVAEGLLPVASVCRLAGWSRLAFERLLGERKIPAGYTTDDLDQDVHTLSSG